MGAQVASGGGGRGGNGRRRRRAFVMNEINITPMVDVMLVLLIIFMVAAPLMTVSVPLDLPQASARAIQQDKPPITVSVRQNGEIYLGDNKVEQAQLVEQLRTLAQNGAEERIFVRGDAAVNYQAIMDVLSQIKGGGFTKVALVATERASR
ncbi:protein TolR [Phreatobacter sp. AB_2022a]|uniref:protein TolR n=1 Tax=Phreatobacter sp. AB_2022a TaxID=3003134 RepID=UPI00056F82F3|nr:protein TolR [Phreatobacter sp. AB_2022a]MCZ0735231.1 protein TolR [Phreatobacter sp. AB_2022a]CEJ14351.1 Biopolymer transport protein ExbD [bacterium YEK0313]